MFRYTIIRSRSRDIGTLLAEHLRSYSSCLMENSVTMQSAGVRTKDVLPVSLDSLIFCLVSEYPAFTA